MPVALKALVITGPEGRILRSNVAEPVPPVLMALRVTLDWLGPVAVPEISPVEGSTLKPGGSPLALKLSGLLPAMIW